MASALEKLFFTITLLDKVSGPSKGVCNSFRRMQQQGKDAFQLMGKGALGLTTAAVGLNAFTGPARDFNQALREVASLGTAPEELARLEKASKQFAMQFGGDAAEVARSAYDIQSAIPGLTDGALAAFTYQSNVMATATKATSAQMTAYTGTMYNIFEDQAKKIGQAKWMEQLAGKTAQTVKIFKTTGPELQAAFSNLGAMGQKAGVSIDEQLAVLGTLQGSMGGANAGTAYKAFLTRAGTAEQKLGLKFTDQSGKLLPMVKILEKIRTVTGPGQLKLADQTALMQAFGEEGGKAVLNLLDKTEGLKGSIGELSRIQNANPALAMANKMIDPYKKFQATLTVLRITLGQGVLPALDLCLNVISLVLGVVSWLIDAIPGLKYVLGGVIIVVTALTMALSAFYLVIGARKVVSAFVGELRILWAWCLRNSAATHSMTFAQRLGAVSSMLWGRTLGASAIWLKVATVAQWLLNTALYGCPLVWIAAAFLALAGVVALVIVYWDELCGFVMKYADYLLLLLGPIGWVVAAFRNWDKIVAVLSAVWAWFKKTFPNIANLIEKVVTFAVRRFMAGLEFWKNVFVAAWEFIKGIFSGIGDWFAGIWGGVVDAGSVFYDWLSEKLVPLVQFFGSIFEWVAGLPATIWSGIQTVFSGIDGFIGKILGILSKIPGFGWLDPAVSASGVQAEPVVSDVTEARRHDVEAGGVRNTSNTTNNNFGGVSIYAPGGMSPAQLEEWAVLQA